MCITININPKDLGLISVTLTPTLRWHVGTFSTESYIVNYEKFIVVGFAGHNVNSSPSLLSFNYRTLDVW